MNGYPGRAEYTKNMCLLIKKPVLEWKHTQDLQWISIKRPYGRLTVLQHLFTSRSGVTLIVYYVDKFGGWPIYIEWTLRPQLFGPVYFQ